ncbi:hypothetical protein BOTBODRAFT_175442 [Botryobasidium botryosum FD-172 SS1]|uniref:Uncharacterized protein n=1 Tax=Botryobasidium botryosum (strain FD-172 SS1) TaxID=930990 RepID=A0A067MQ68_BOTB1|nr:hypothetical protein BOTBODRAFT_175442 [Botryobasidium botryosum FD-172 SS1]
MSPNLSGAVSPFLLLPPSPIPPLPHSSPPSFLPSLIPPFPYFPPSLICPPLPPSTPPSSLYLPPFSSLQHPSIAQACSPCVATNPTNHISWEDNKDSKEEQEQGLPWAQKDTEDLMREEEEEEDKDVAIMLNEMAGRREDDKDLRNYISC